MRFFLPAAAGFYFWGLPGHFRARMAVRPMILLDAHGDLALLAQSTGPKELLGTLVPLLAFFAIFYFLLILPAQRRSKKVAQMLAALKTGDKVVTNGGIYGTIVGLDEKDAAVQLRIADQVRIKIARSAIAGMQPESKES
jgi:preprotein translocase subunit YajC